MQRFKNFLFEGSLTIGEINKYDWRIKLFLKKYNDGEPFELTDGTSGMIAKSDELEKIIKAGKSPRGYKFKLTNGREISFNQMQKTVEFGGGSRGSGGGAAQTAAAESAQCVYAQCIWDNPNTLWSEDELKVAYGKVNVDTPFDAIMGLPEEWRVSSILGSRILKRGIGRRRYKWYRGLGIQSEMEERFKKLNIAAGRPFNNVNKWTPADIWAVKNGKTFDFSQFSTLGEFTNELKERYDSQDLVGVSLKLASGSVTVEEKNTTGFIRRPVIYGNYDKQSNFFKSKDFYIYLGKQKMQLRTFSPVSSWQGESKGKGAAAGKIGGGVLEAIMVRNSTLTKFPYTNAQLKILANKPTPAFLDEMYNMYVGLVSGKVEPKDKWIKQASAKRIGRVTGADWRFSKFRGMFFVAQLEDNKSIANKICDNIAAYSLSASDEAAPHVVYK